MKRKLQIIDKIALIYIITIALMVITIIIGVILLFQIKKSPVTEETPVMSIPKSTTEIEFVKVISTRVESPQEVISEWAVNVTETELEEMSRVVMNEASILPYIGKVLVAQVMINRLQDGRWGETMHDVLYYDGAFSHSDCNGEITDECRSAVLQALECSNAFPKDLLYFRADYPHPFGYQYAVVGNTYFSTEKDYEGGVIK